MFKRIAAILTFAIVAGDPVLAQEPMIPAPPAVAAKSYLLMDANSGRVLVEHNTDMPLPPASLTKLMTSYVLAHELDAGNVSEDDMVTISKNAWAQNPVFKGSSLMWIEVGKQVSLGDLHKGIVISSGNDASVAVAEYLSGSEDAFAGIMNEHARRLGMTSTNFMNSHGLPHPDHVTTARDLSLLALAMLEHPEHYALYKERSFTYNGIEQSNRNRLLWKDSSVDGLKTGHTEEAGYCLVASADREGMRLVSVVMGTNSKGARERETQKLLAYGYRYYETHLTYQAGAELQQHKLWKGVADEVSLGITEDVWLTIPRGRHDDVRGELIIDKVLMAPIRKGEVLGTLQITLDGEKLAQKQLVALRDVEEGSFFRRIWHTVVLFVLDFIDR